MEDQRQRREERWQTWMIAVQQGDRAAYEKLLAELIPELRGFVRRRLSDASVQEDVVQNILVAVHRARHTYRSERPFAPWLYAVARNAVRDQLRAGVRRGRRELTLAPERMPEPAEMPEPPGDAALSPELERALAELPDAQREAVLLVQVEGLSVAEAAQRAGVSRSALKVRAHRGYRALRALLGSSS